MTRDEMLGDQNIRALMELGEAQLLLRLGVARQITHELPDDPRRTLDGGVNDQIAALEEALQRLRNRPPPVVVGLDALTLHARKG